MRIRSMTARDAREVAALSSQLGYPSTAAEIEKRFRAAAQAPDSALDVAETDDGRVVGWVHVVGRHFLESEPYVEIAGLVVDAGARRHGVGWALVAEAETWAKERGYGTMRIRSNTARVEARPFYEQVGYEIIKTQYVFRKSLKA